METYFTKLTPLTPYELNALFPDYKADWKYVQDMVGIKNLRLPEIYYQLNSNFLDYETDGIYYGNFRNITIDQANFASSTIYAQYVLIHEMTHAALAAYSGFDHKEDDHCYMVRMGYFRKIGALAGSPALGISEEARHIKLYNCKQ